MTIEQCFQEGKSFLGMGSYEHRSWPAWHRRMIYVFLAQHLVLRLRLRWKKTPALTLPQALKIVATILPLRSWNRREVLRIIRYQTRRNHQGFEITRTDGSAKNCCASLTARR